MLVPNSWVSKLLNKHRGAKGLLPIGVAYIKRVGKYSAKCRCKGEQKTLGYYSTAEEAFLAYKEFKEAYVQSMARESRDTLNPEMYAMMMNWEVNIDD